MTDALRSDDRLAGVLADLTAEGAALDALVASLDSSQWRAGTPAPGWDIAHQIAHLAWTDEAAVIAATDKRAWDDLVLAAIEDPTGFVDAAAARGAAVDAADLLVRWRRARTLLVNTLADHPAAEKMPWFGPPMGATSMATARFMETWAHGLDVADALGVSSPPTDRIRHIVHLGVRTRNFAYGVHGLIPPAEEFRIELVAPSGETWTFGPADAPQRVSGSAYHFCLLVTQRRNRGDLDLVAGGDDANAWLDIAQVFAGPPGAGREPNAAAPVGEGA